MTERERLVKKLLLADRSFEQRALDGYWEHIADYLLAHGVVCLGFPISHKERNKLKHIALTDRKLKEKWEKG